MGNVPKEKSANRFGVNLRWQLIANAGQAFFGGLFILLLGRLLGPAEFGIFSAIVALVSVVSLVTDMRLHEVVARDFCHLDEGQWTKPTDRFYLVDLCILDGISRLLPCLLLVLFASHWGPMIQLAASNTTLLVLATVGFFFSRLSNNISVGLLRVLGRTDLIAFCTIGDWGLRLVTVMAVSMFTTLTVTVALWTVALVSSLANFTQCLLTFRVLADRIGQDFWLGWRFEKIISRLRQASRMVFASMGLSASELMAKDLDIALLARLLSEDKVGVYKMAKTAIQLLWRAIDPFYLAIMPEVQKLWQKNDFTGLKRLLVRTSLFLAGLAVLLTGLGYGGALWLVEPFLGEGFKEVPGLMLVMSPWVILCAPIIWGLSLSIAVNRPEFATYGSFIGLLIGLISYNKLTPLYGLNGAAIAWNLTLLSGMLLTFILSVTFASQHVSHLQKPE